MGGACASFLKGAGGFVCFSAVPGEVTAIPALSQKHIHLCEKRRPLNSDERPMGLRCTGRQTVHRLQYKHNIGHVIGRQADRQRDGWGGETHSKKERKKDRKMEERKKNIPS